MAALQPVSGGTVRIALAAKDSLYHLPLTLAEQLGYFRQAGLFVEWASHESGAHALGSVLQGRADVAAGAFAHLFSLQNKGLNYQAFVQMGRTPQISMGVSVRQGLRAQAIVKGTRLGITSLESSTHWMACQWLLQNGLSMEDVVFIEVGSSAAAADALRQGVLDALCQPDPLMHGLEQKNDIRVIAEARTLLSTRKFMGGAVPGACLFSRADFLQRRPDLAQALSDAVVRALKWLQTAGPTDILKTVPVHHWWNDRAVYLGAFEKLRESYALDGLIAADAVHNAWRVHHRMLGRFNPARVNLEQTYTNAFVLKSKKRFTA